MSRCRRHRSGLRRRGRGSRAPTVVSGWLSAALPPTPSRCGPRRRQIGGRRRAAQRRAVSSAEVAENDRHVGGRVVSGSSRRARHCGVVAGELPRPEVDGVQCRGTLPQALRPPPVTGLLAGRCGVTTGRHGIRQPASSSPSAMRHDAGSIASTMRGEQQHAGPAGGRSHVAASNRPRCGSRLSTPRGGGSATAATSSPVMCTSMTSTPGVPWATRVMVSRSNRHAAPHGGHQCVDHRAQPFGGHAVGKRSASVWASRRGSPCP